MLAHRALVIKQFNRYGALYCELVLQLTQFEYKASRTRGADNINLSMDDEMSPHSPLTLTIKLIITVNIYTNLPENEDLSQILCF